ncbi:MAG TPA: hypothetical protein VG166_04875 [Caulobacteraceae bacterium]|nr:hypothetical protein [Caulobacteraceae bacterium]
MPPPLVLTPDRMTGFPPGVQDDTLMHNFCIQGDQATIQKALDARFDAPSGGRVRYEAVGSKLFVSVAEIGRIFSTDPLDSHRGWMTEIDVAVWAIARLGLSLRFIPLWLFVDNSVGMATGREVYGFPKQIGRFAFTPRNSEPRSFETVAFVSPVFTPETECVWAPMISIKPSAAAPEPGAGSVWSDLKAFARHAIEQLEQVVVDADLALMSAATQALGVGQSTLAFLKQFPDAVDARLACYQGIIETDIEVTATRSLKMTQTPYTIEINNYASHPILEEFGIAPGVQDVGHGIVADMNFTIGAAREVWRAS